MDITLQSNIIVIRTSRESLELEWMSSFIKNYKEELLFLSHSVIIYHNEAQEEQKREFLTKACELYADTESLDSTFFIKAILCCIHYPVKIEMSDTKLRMKNLDVTLKALEGHRISMTLNRADPWFFVYMQSKLSQHFEAVSEREMVFVLDSLESKGILERSLNRNHIFSRRVKYHYDEDFLRKMFECGKSANRKVSHHYYAILGCDANATADELKSSYKKLVKAYHPDRIVHLNDEAQIGAYTRKFQMVQEAYQALKGA